MKTKERQQPALAFEGECLDEGKRVPAPKSGPTTADLIRTLGLKPTFKERVEKEAER